MLEALVALVVSVILIFVGTKAFRFVMENHNEAKRLKGMNDVVSSTAEWLSVKARDTLLARYADWSAPEPLGDGKYSFRYRVVAAPTVGGQVRDSLLGLQIQTGAVRGGAFQAADAYVTVFLPNSGANLGQYSTVEERNGERAWYAAHTVLANTTINSARATDPTYLDSHNCYEPDRCCGVEYDYLQSFVHGTPLPAADTADGMNSKCYYRCVKRGNVDPGVWKDKCRLDICGMVPWRDASQCCAARAAGQCDPGSFCDRACGYCFHADSLACANNRDDDPPDTNTTTASQDNTGATGKPNGQYDSPWPGGTDDGSNSSRPSGQDGGGSD